MNNKKRGKSEGEKRQEGTWRILKKGKDVKKIAERRGREGDNMNKLILRKRIIFFFYFRPGP